MQATKCALVCQKQKKYMGRSYTKIGLLDHLGGGNLGDDATLAAVMQNVNSRWPDAVIFGFSMNPADTQARHGIPSYAIRRRTWTYGINNAPSTLKQKMKSAIGKYPFFRCLLKAINTVAIRIPTTLIQELSFLAKSLHLIRSFDLLIISGGGQLTDWGGPWLFPYTLFKWVFLAKLGNVDRIFLNVGAGPLSHPLSRFFIRRALYGAHYVSFRDHASRALVHKAGYRGQDHVYPDAVYSLDGHALNHCDIPCLGKPVVGIAPMPYFDPRSIYPDKDQHAYDGFIRTLGRFGSSLVDDNYSVTLFCSDISIDPPVIADLEIFLRSCRPADVSSITTTFVESLNDLFTAISSMDYVITCRFHGVVFAHMLNKPVLAISHHPKVATLMGDLGLSRYCLDIQSCDTSLLTEAFRSLVANRDDIKRRMAEKFTGFKSQLSIQFDALFPPRLADRRRMSNSVMPIAYSDHS